MNHYEREARSFKLQVAGVFLAVALNVGYLVYLAPAWKSPKLRGSLPAARRVR